MANKANHKLPQTIPRFLGRGVKLIWGGVLWQRVVVLVLAACLLGGGTFVLVNRQNTEKQPSTSAQKENKESQEPGQASTQKSAPASSDSSSAQSSTASAPPTSTGQGPSTTSTAATQASVQILADVPKTTFRIGETSGTIAIRTSDNRSVVWTIEADYPSPIYVQQGHFNAASTNTFVVKTNSSGSGSYNVRVQAYDTKLKKTVASKTLTFTILPQATISINAMSSYTFDRMMGDAFGMYCTIVPLVDGVSWAEVDGSLSLVSGSDQGFDFGFYLTDAPDCTY